MNVFSSRELRKFYNVLCKNILKFVEISSDLLLIFKTNFLGFLEISIVVVREKTLHAQKKKRK